MKSTSTLLLILLAACVGAAVLIFRPQSARSEVATAEPQQESNSPFVLPVQLEAQPEAASQFDSSAVAQPNIIAPSDIDAAGAVYASELDTAIQGGAVPNQSPNTTVDGFTPPSIEVPQAVNPYDHFWFIRPVASNNRNAGLINYPYGSRGPGGELRVHHGIDISNPIGVEVIAAGSGFVVWADEGHYDQSTGEAITTYGNTVVIQHDFGYNGNELFTLYAHMSALLVAPGDHVEAGDVIGLIGDTGLVSGPHVHLEVRYGTNRYQDVRNPDLWIAPYAGTGVVAGRIELEGQPYIDHEIQLRPCRGNYVTHRTTAYAGPGAVADDHWNENFAIPDVPAGCYKAESTYGSIRWTGEVDVIEGSVNWVDITLDPTTALLAPPLLDDTAPQEPTLVP